MRRFRSRLATIRKLGHQFSGSWGTSFPISASCDRAAGPHGRRQEGPRGIQRPVRPGSAGHRSNDHPHICTLYDIGPDFIVMEYVEGKPLRGPIALEEAVPYAIQIANALSAAHRKGIIHRDRLRVYPKLAVR
jgi:serine/threonine protein kinase